MKATSHCNSENTRHDPFGKILSGRSWEVGIGYRYGFNAQEQDDEVYGNGNLNAAEYWEYDTRLGRRWNLDPIDNYYESPYVVFGNSPLGISDVRGDVKSTHTDEEGNIIAVYNDGDNGVYKHKGNESVATEELTKLYSSTNTSGGGESMGTTEYWDEFARIDNKTGVVKTAENGSIKFVDAQIHFGQSMDGIIKELNDEVAKMFDGLSGKAYYKALNKLADMEKNGERYDIKSWYTGSATDNSPNQYDGFLLNGKYATVRSGGNYLAGLNAATVKPKLMDSKAWYLTAAKKAGELHMKRHGLDKAPNPAYNYGEIEYTSRMFYAGFIKLYELPTRQKMYEDIQNQKKRKWYEK